MPLRTKILIASLAASGVILVLLLELLFRKITGHIIFIPTAAVALLAIYFLFVYYPKFDFTFSTFWHGDRRNNTIALTFDDGPGPDTPAILDILKEHGIKATFFILGENAARYPEFVERARAEGHAIGNHGTSHVKMHRLSSEEIKNELNSAEKTIGEISKRHGKKIMRSPHGFKSFTFISVLRGMNYTPIAWTTGVWDSDRPGADVIASRALKALKPGCILLLHDGDGTKPDADRRQTAEALEKIIADFLRAGYKFATIPDMQ